MSFIRGSKVVLLILLITPVTVLFSQDKIKWLTWQELEQVSKQQPRKVMVDLYTDWCGWCKKMDSSTFTDPNITRYINENYYAVKFNAESKESVDFNSKTYKFVRTARAGYNELALELSNGKLSYPTIIFLDESFKMIQPIHGFLPAEKFEMIITYFGQDHHKTTPWVTYQKNYKSSPENNSIHLTNNRN